MYEAVASLVGTCSRGCFPFVAELGVEMVKRLQATVEMQRELVSSDDRTSLQELQGNICSVITVSVGGFLIFGECLLLSCGIQWGFIFV